MSQSKNSATSRMGMKGSDVQKEMLDNFTTLTWKDKSGETKSTNMTKIGGVTVELNNISKSDIKETRDKTFEVLNDMIQGNKLTSVSLSSLYRPDKKTKGDEIPHSVGRGIDITAATRGTGKDVESVRFRDLPGHEQKDEPGLAKDLTSWLRSDSRVNQVLTPWSMGNNTPNENSTKLEKQHKNHMHVGINE